jgi:hypothetical protein
MHRAIRIVSVASAGMVVLTGRATHPVLTTEARSTRCGNRSVPGSANDTKTLQELPFLTPRLLFFSGRRDGLSFFPVVCGGSHGFLRRRDHLRV